MLLNNRHGSVDSDAYRYGFNGKEEDDEVKGEGSSYDFGARMYDNRLVRFMSLDPAAKDYPGLSDYHFVRNNPILRIDPTGKWDITVHVFNDRSKYGFGVAIVKNDAGKVIARYTVRVEGTNHSANSYNKRDRSRTNADTPLGVYDIPTTGTWIAGSTTGKKRKAYGPNHRLALNGTSGEIETSGRSNIRFHGGRQETESANVTTTTKPDGTVVTNTTYTYSAQANPSLKCTYGCFRMYDADVLELKTLTDALPVEDAAGNVTVVADLKEYNGNYYLKEDYDKIIKYDNSINDLSNNNDNYDKGSPVLIIKLTEQYNAAVDKKLPVPND
ncbi:RHS repeat protein [Nonlabens xylanidelens]|nr:RHS repeat-associated core domain-containing protein [Nonlabens xylanidelens]PQJ19509.1 hypothetical protein BST94_06700 [Nonlabens xylanidelens]PQJ19528.1 hypothetical protein BST94_06655 [Nonlabens xylanidelens]PQJ19550.1 hypothetical protein BST94_06610 [Nonlabens xylanidelens]PQJ19639.1 hypothetical protein BST94_06570 [Nonlabens xylanidelens]